MADNKRALKTVDMRADVVVIGGGIAGICAAVSAARQEMSVVLICDRPVLGGNASMEIRGGVHSGAAHSPFNIWSRETGLVEEMWNRHAACWSGDSETYSVTLDRVYLDMTTAEKSLKLLFNTSVDRVETDGSRITAVGGVQQRSETLYRVTGNAFIDCSGDGVVGWLSGADCRIGREARSEFGESMAPEKSDSKTMGSTLLWFARDTGRPVPFRAPDWALDISGLPCLVDHGSDYTRMFNLRPGPDGRYYNSWWAEYGGLDDSVHDDAEIDWHLKRLSYGMWNWIKNSGRVSGVENYELAWMASIGGKRESRRLLGPVILTENDFRGQKAYDDAVAYTGWPIDIHAPGGYTDTDLGCTHVYLPGPADIPIRALYSRNMDNLLFAGRDFSGTHVALGSARIMATCGTMGQAAGTAAALCLQQGCLPRELSEAGVAELRRRLLRGDQSIMGAVLSEEDDLAPRAEVTASSTRRFELTEAPLRLYLDHKSGAGDERAVIGRMGGEFSGGAGVVTTIPAAGMTRSIHLRFDGRRGQKITAAVYLADRPQNYTLARQIVTSTAVLDDDGWAEFVLNADPGEGLKFLLLLPPEPGPALHVSDELIPGAAAVRLWDDNRQAMTRTEHQFSKAVFTPCFRVEPYLDLLGPACVADGHIRPLGLPRMWSSEAMVPGREEWLELTWEGTQTIGRVELVFDSQLQARDGMDAATLVRRYRLSAERDGRLETLLQVCGNEMRFRVHEFPAVQTRRLRLYLDETAGARFASLYALRVYPA